MRNKEDRILERLYGPRDSYTLEEVEFARRAIRIANEDAGRSRLPRRDVRVGEYFYKTGIKYVCVKRPARYSQTAVPSEACAGCDLRRNMNNCEGPRCSCFVRSDGQNVWFKEVAE